jgi:hypothetical protein
MKALTFGVDVEGDIEVEILSGPSPTGLFIVTDGKRKMARHRDRLMPLDKEAEGVIGE